MAASWLSTSNRFKALALGVVAWTLAGCASMPADRFYWEAHRMPREKMVALAAKSPQHRAEALRRFLARIDECKRTQRCADPTDTPEENLARIELVLEKTRTMRGPPLVDVKVAVKVLSADTLSRMFDAGAIVVPSDPRQKAPFYKAIWEDRADAERRYRVLMENGLPVDEIDPIFAAAIAEKTEDTAFVGAVMQRAGRSDPMQVFDHVGYAARLKKRGGLSDDDYGNWIGLGRSPFDVAMRAGNTPLVVAWVKKGRGPGSLDLLRTMGGDDAAKRRMAELLVANGTSPRVECIDGPVMGLAEYLLEKGNAPNGSCRPLTTALAMGNLRAARALLDKGARPDEHAVAAALRQHRRWHPNGTVARSGAGAPGVAPPARTSAPTTGELLAAMLAGRAIDLVSWRERDDRKDTLLHLAARADLADAVAMLVEAGASLETPNAHEELPLDAAGPRSATLLEAKGARRADPAKLVANRQQREADAQRLAALAAEDQRRMEEQERLARIARDRADQEAEEEEREQLREERREEARRAREREAREARDRAQAPVGPDFNALREYALRGTTTPPPPRSFGSAPPPPPPSRSSGVAAPPPRSSPPPTTGGGAGSSGSGFSLQTSNRKGPDPEVARAAERGREQEARARAAAEQRDRDAKVREERARAEQAQRSRDADARRERCRRVEDQQREAASRRRDCEATCKRQTSESSAACKKEQTISRTMSCEREVRVADQACIAECSGKHAGPKTPDECRGTGTAR